MASHSFWKRLRKGRLVQVVLIYLGASWVVLQIGDTLEDALDLPAWVLPTAFLLLLVGLVIVAATAWIQSHPLVSERAAAEELPSAWELDARDLRGALRERRLPHLTWPRALLAGAAAFLLLGIAAASYVLTRGDRGFGSASPASAATLPGLAVLPFTVSGEGADVWREGMVDVLSTNLDGAAGLRTIDSRNVLARWREHVGDAEADAQLSLRAARATGARYALLGNVVSLGDRVRLSADLYDLDSGQKLGASARAEGPRDSLFMVIDRFSVEIVREALRQEGITGTRELYGVERLTTSSLPALLAFLEGEAAFRRAEFRLAIDAYEAAIAADSTFALPSYRLSHAYGWSESVSAASTTDAADRAMRHAHRLSPRDAALVRLTNATLRLGIADSIRSLRALAERYPDDPEIWHELGEAIAHSGHRALIPMREAVEAFQRTIQLDSAFAPAYIHTIEFAVQRGDLDEARRLLGAYQRFADDQARARRLSRIIALVEGGDPRALLDTVSTRDVREMQVSLVMMPDQADIIGHVAQTVAERPDATEQQRFFGNIVGAFGHMMAGRPSAALRIADHLPPGPRFLVRYVASLEAGVEPTAQLAGDAAAVPDDASFDVMLNLGGYAVERGEAALRDRVIRLLRERAAEERDTSAGQPSPRTLLNAQAFEAGVEAIRAYTQLRAGNASAALPVFEMARHSIHGTAVEMDQSAALVRLWEAEALARLGRHREAAQVYESVPWSVNALYEAARAWEAAGDDTRARALYARVSRMWRNAEPGFALAGEARTALERTAPDR